MALHTTAFVASRVTTFKGTRGPLHPLTTQQMPPTTTHVYLHSAMQPRLQIIHMAPARSRSAHTFNQQPTPHQQPLLSLSAVYISTPSSHVGNSCTALHEASEVAAQPHSVGLGKPLVAQIQAMPLVLRKPYLAAKQAPAGHTLSRIHLTARFLDLEPAATHSSTEASA